MFERFTREARAAVTGAQQIARGMGHTSIDSGHLLLSMYAEEGSAQRALSGCRLDPADLRRRVKNVIDGLDPEALAMIGIDLDRVREATEASFGPGALDPMTGPVKSGHIPFTGESKKILELSLRQAVKNKNNFICGGHILLAALMLPDCTATRVLRDSRVNLESLKQETLREISADTA